MNTDEQFEAVFAAYARQSALQRQRQKSPEQIERERREAKRNDPRHMKALAKRRKRKRGGPK